MKKRSKIILGAVCLSSATLLLTGCDLKLTTTKNNDAKSQETTKEQKSKGNCKVFDCIKKIEITDSLDKVNSIMGFEGEQTNEGNGWKKYTWKLNDDDSVMVTIYDSGSGTVNIDFDNDSIKNSKVDFSGFADLKKDINGGGTVTYDTMKSTFKAEGTLIEKSSFSNKYRWVNGDGGYMDASFSLSSGKCTFAMGRY